MVIRCQLVHAGRGNKLRCDSVWEWGVEYTWSAMGVAADTAVADVDFEGEGVCGDGNGEVDTFAVAGCCEGFAKCHFVIEKEVK